MSIVHNKLNHRTYCSYVCAQKGEKEKYNCADFVLIGTKSSAEKYNVDTNGNCVQCKGRLLENNKKEKPKNEYRCTFSISIPCIIDFDIEVRDNLTMRQAKASLMNKMLSEYKDIIKKHIQTTPFIDNDIKIDQEKFNIILNSRDKQIQSIKEISKIEKSEMIYITTEDLEKEKDK